jgi:hypothetical protein
MYELSTAPDRSESIVHQLQSVRGKFQMRYRTIDERRKSLKTLRRTILAPGKVSHTL